MKINELNLLRNHEQQCNELQKMYFLKCKELNEFEGHLRSVREQIKQLTLNSRAKLKNSKLKTH